MYRYISVLDTDFWLRHLKRKPSHEGKDQITPIEKRNWDRITMHICERSIVELVKTCKVQLEDLNDPETFYVFNKYFGGNEVGHHIDPEKITADNYQTALSPIFFLDNRLKYFTPTSEGYIKFNSTINFSNYIDSEENPTEYLITQKRENNLQIDSWDQCKILKHNFRSLIICDNYLFKNKKLIASNLIPLLCNLISESVKCKISVLIITKEVYEEGSFNNVYEYIMSLIRNTEKLKNRNIDLTLCKKELREGHDRNIISDYLRIELSNSLSFFSPTGKKIGPSTVKLNPYPHIRTNGRNTYGDNTLSLLREIYTIYRRIPKSNIINDREIPLFNIFI